MVRAVRRDFSGPVPAVWGSPNASHIRCWRQFKRQRNISSITLSALRDFAAFLVAECGYSSTNSYLSSAVSYEQVNIVEPLLERGYKSLRASVTSFLNRQGHNPRKAFIPASSAVENLKDPCGNQLSPRLRMISSVGFSLGLRAKTLCGIRANEVRLRFRGDLLSGLSIDIKRHDKTSAFRTLDCTLRFPLSDDDAVALSSIFPIRESELKLVALACGGSLHSMRRAAAVRARLAWEASSSDRSASLILAQANRRLGWSSSSLQLFEYSSDYGLHSNSSVPRSMFIEDL